MKSPITGKEMKLCKERRQLSFRKEVFDVIFHYYLDENNGEQFTTTDLDNLNLSQVYNQYRDRFNIPFTEEIKAIREQYGVPLTKMSAILGFGVNSYGQYEKGDIPSISNGRLIQIAADPMQFLGMVELCEELDEKTKIKYKQKAHKLLDEQKRNKFRYYLNNYFLGDPLPDIYSGYRKPNLKKLTEMIKFFAERIQPFKTKLNKLLFYADFLMFKQTCFSISGTRYRAINMGPVPHNFQSVFEYLGNSKEIMINYVVFPKGYIGEQFLIADGNKFDVSVFAVEEMELLNKVADMFKDTSTNDIVDLSHLESAWQDNHDDKTLISYNYAFDIQTN